MGFVRATIDEREYDMGTKQVRIEEVERGFLYLQGCLDIARTRSTDLSRDFDYVERKLSAARPGLIDRGLFAAVIEALKTSRQLADQGRYEQADDTLSAMAGRLKAAGPQPSTPGRAYPRH
jgi:hypothetical protein